MFSDIMHRLPKEAIDFIASKDAETDRVSANKSIAKYLMDDRRKLFTSQSESWCSVHNRACKAQGAPHGVRNKIAVIPLFSCCLVRVLILLDGGVRNFSPVPGVPSVYTRCVTAVAFFGNSHVIKELLEPNAS